MDLQQVDGGSPRRDWTTQDILDSKSPISPCLSEDEIDLSPGKDGSTPSPKVRVELRLSLHDEDEIDIKVKGGVAAILVDMKKDMEQKASNAECENRSSVVGRFKEEPGLEDETSLSNVQMKRVEAPHSPNTRSHKQSVIAPAGTDGFPYLRGSLAPRSIASSLSPYCQVMTNPSWETSEGYHQ
jgi:hypothetical protein